MKARSFARLSVAFTLAIACSSIGVAQSRIYELRRISSSGVEEIALDRVRDGALHYIRGGRADSVTIDDIDELRISSRSHLLGALAGLGGGTLAVFMTHEAILTLSPETRRAELAPMVLIPVYLLVLGAGTVGGAVAGLSTSSVVYDGEEVTEQTGRVAALERLILDEELWRTEVSR